jgi:hypothetical protein
MTRPSRQETPLEWGFSSLYLVDALLLLRIELFKRKGGELFRQNLMVSIRRIGMESMRSTRAERESIIDDNAFFSLDPDSIDLYNY